MRTVVVCGAGGFIGGHLVRDLLVQGHQRVRAVDIKPLDQWHQLHEGAENLKLDLRLAGNCHEALHGAHEVYNLAADMGGMGFIENNKARCMLSVLINTHLLEAARRHCARRFFYASSACVYNADKQSRPDVSPLSEADAYPALPEDGYGWEKLFSERMCRHFREDFGVETRVARFHNVYGPWGTWDGGREKAPAAIIRKVIEARLTGSNRIEIWGDGTATRSFMYIDDCIHGTRMIADSEILEPINLGSSELVSINGLVDIVEEIAGVRLERKHKLDAPTGVNGRNSDNRLIRKELDWEPSIALKDGLARTYAWIHDEYVARHGRVAGQTISTAPWAGSATSGGSNGRGNENGEARTAPPAEAAKPGAVQSVIPIRTAGERRRTFGLLGAGGFIGSHLVEHLLRRGERVVGVDITDEKLEGIGGPGLEFHTADLRVERGILDDIIRDSDVVVDLVAHANPSLYVTSPVEVFELNFKLNLDVAESCMRYDKRLIQYSSAEVYGKAGGDGFYSEDETDFVFGPVCKQRWIYAAGKALLERVLYAHGVAGNLEYTVIRPFNFVGSRIDYLVPAGAMGGPRVFPHFMSALMTGGPMYLVDGGEAHRAFLHIADACTGFQILMDRWEDSRNRTFNMGNPESDISIRALAVLMRELYEEITGERSHCELIEVSGEEFYGVGYEDSNRLPPDTRKIRSLGWRPRHDLRTTFRDAMIYYLEHPEQVPASHEEAGNGPNTVEESEPRRRQSPL